MTRSRERENGPAPATRASDLVGSRVRLMPGDTYPDAEALVVGADATQDPPVLSLLVTKQPSAGQAPSEFKRTLGSVEIVRLPKQKLGTSEGGFKRGDRVWIMNGSAGHTAAEFIRHRPKSNVAIVRLQGTGGRDEEAEIKLHSLVEDAVFLAVHRAPGERTATRGQRAASGNGGHAERSSSSDGSPSDEAEEEPAVPQTRRSSRRSSVTLSPERRASARGSAQGRSSHDGEVVLGSTQGPRRRGSVSIANGRQTPQRGVPAKREAASLPNGESADHGARELAESPSASERRGRAESDESSGADGRSEEPAENRSGLQEDAHAEGRQLSDDDGDADAFEGHRVVLENGARGVCTHFKGGGWYRVQLDNGKVVTVRPSLLRLEAQDGDTGPGASGNTRNAQGSASVPAVDNARGDLHTDSVEAEAAAAAAPPTKRQRVSGSFEEQHGMPQFPASSAAEAGANDSDVESQRSGSVSEGCGTETPAMSPDEIVAAAREAGVLTSGGASKGGSVLPTLPGSQEELRAPSLLIMDKEAISDIRSAAAGSAAALDRLPLPSLLSLRSELSGVFSEATILHACCTLDIASITRAIGEAVATSAVAERIEGAQRRAAAEICGEREAPRTTGQGDAAEQGETVCGFMNSRGRPCMRVGYCPFHHQAKEGGSGHEHANGSIAGKQNARSGPSSNVAPGGAAAASSRKKPMPVDSKAPLAKDAGATWTAGMKPSHSRDQSAASGAQGADADGEDGGEICGVINSRGRPCQRTGYCPFHDTGARNAGGGVAAASGSGASSLGKARRGGIASSFPGAQIENGFVRDVTESDFESGDDEDNRPPASFGSQLPPSERERLLRIAGERLLLLLRAGEQVQSIRENAEPSPRVNGMPLAQHDGAGASESGAGSREVPHEPPTPASADAPSAHPGCDYGATSADHSKLALEPMQSARYAGSAPIPSSHPQLANVYGIKTAFYGGAGDARVAAPAEGYMYAPNGSTVAYFRDASGQPVPILPTQGRDPLSGPGAPSVSYVHAPHMAPYFFQGHMSMPTYGHAAHKSA